MRGSPFLFFVAGVMFGFFMPHHASASTIGKAATRDWLVCTDRAVAEKLVYQFSQEDDDLFFDWDTMAVKTVCGTVSKTLTPKALLSTTPNMSESVTNLYVMEPDEKGITYYWLEIP